MKKKLLLSFIILFCIMIMPMGVEAKTECEYVLDKKDFIPVTFLLETENNSKKLTKVTLFAETSVDLGDPKFANGKGLDLNSDGSCPDIVVYDQRIMGGYKIYKTMTTCKDGFWTADDRCYELSGTFRDSSSSESNQTGAGSQYKASLSNSSGNSCTYEHSYEYNNNGDSVTNSITINSSSNNTVSGSCDIYLANSCRLVVDVPNRFYNNNTFTCPAYIYVRAEASGRDGTNYTYTIYDTGDENDEDRSHTEFPDDEWEQLSEDLSKEDFDHNIVCDDIINMEEGHVGWLINTILNYIKIIGPVLVVLLSAIDFIKAVVGFDEKAMKEAQSKLVIRLVAALCLFLVPTLVQLLLSFINATTCTLG